jgi:hypothetical protein
MATIRPALGMRILGVVFAIAAASDAWNVGTVLLGWNEEPWVIVGIHVMIFVIALACAVGLWRGKRWATPAVVLWGVATALFIVSLGPLLVLEPAARGGLWVGAAAVLVFAFAVAAYARRHIVAPASGAAVAAD